MFKKILLISLLLLTGCISVAVDEPPTAQPQGFVTSTLPPTKAEYIPLTLTPTPDVTSTPQVALTIPPNCKDRAVLLRDVTIPDGTVLKPGEKFTKTWEFKNTGDCPWLNYTLKFAAGEQLSAPLESPIPLTMPGALVEISVELSAPSTPGEYTGYFTLNNPNGKDVPIGNEKTFWVKIVVE